MQTAISSSRITGPVVPDGYISDFADVCHFDLVSSVSCESPLLIASGSASYTEQNGRWGDYSAAQVDPNSPNNFWVFQELAADSNNFATQITEIGPATPEPDTLGMMALAGLAIAFRARRSRKVR
jgi:hypothetical protein